MAASPAGAAGGAALDGSDDGPEAEAFLWSLGVGEGLAGWLKELRREEQAHGLNRGARRGCPSPSRLGIGPQQLARAAAPAPAPATTPAFAPAPAPACAPAPAPLFAPTPRAAPAVAGASAAESGAPAERAGAQAAAGAAAHARAAPRAAPVEASRPATSATPATPAAPAPCEAWRAGADSAAPAAAAAPPRAAPAPCGVSVPVRCGAGAGVGAGIRSGPATDAPRAAAPPAEVWRAEAAAQAPASALGRFELSMEDWLHAMDESGFLAQYHDSLMSKMDSVQRVVDVYLRPGGEVDPQFFADAGIKKLGHKRLFEKWFREHGA